MSAAEYRGPVRLRPIAWRRRDYEAARGVIRSIIETTPPRVIPCQPLREAKIREVLNQIGVDHD